MSHKVLCFLKAAFALTCDGGIKKQAIKQVNLYVKNMVYRRQLVQLDAQKKQLRVLHKQRKNPSGNVLEKQEKFIINQKPEKRKGGRRSRNKKTQQCCLRNERSVWAARFSYSYGWILSPFLRNPVPLLFDTIPLLSLRWLLCLCRFRSSTPGCT